MIKKMVIADDELVFSASLYNYIKENNRNIDIVGMATNGKDTLELIEKLKPDILLLDLDMPKINGLEVLEKIKYKNILVILISGEISFINDIKIQNFQIVKQIYIKPFDLKKISDDLLYYCENNDILDLRQKIIQELKMLNFNQNSIGYTYLIEALTIAYENENIINNMESNLYGIIAKRFNKKNTKTIKWNIDKTINSMVRYTPRKTLQELFQYTDKPTAKMLISTINEELNKKYKM